MKQHSVTTAFILLLVSAVAAIIVSGCSQYGSSQGNAQAPAALTPPAAPEAPAVTAQPEAPPAPPVARAATNTIEITASGFSPSPLTVKAGETVTFVNKDAAQHWPASAIHPTHTVYPEAGGCIGSKFDACKGLATGEEFKFTFNEKGSWKYHDHLNPSLWGTIVVE